MLPSLNSTGFAVSLSSWQPVPPTGPAGDVSDRLAALSRCYARNEVRTVRTSAG